MEEQKYSSIETDNDGFISIPYCNYVAENINIYQFLINLEETNQINNIIIRIQDITSVQIVSGRKIYQKNTCHWMAFSLRNGHIVFSRISNNNEAEKMEGIVRKYISDSFRCRIKIKEN